MKTAMLYAIWMWALVMRVIIFKLLVLDCSGNRVVGESFKHTLSATAWKKRWHKHWGWTHKAIDAVFGTDHCQIAYEREIGQGSVWVGWWEKTKRVYRTRP